LNVKGARSFFWLPRYDEFMLLRPRLHTAPLWLGPATMLPLVQGDRFQLQQVILSLIINEIEARGGLGERPQELLISTAKAERTVCSSGCRTRPGLVPATLDRIFNAFYTTKPGGLPSIGRCEPRIGRNEHGIEK
jgi:C4-dicarboxylate-specific signal transduction histidine kinase